MTPTDLFYVRNHWKGAPEIDIAAYRLSVDGEVAQNLALTLSMDGLKELPHRRYQATFECCGNGPIPEYWAKQTRSVMEKVTGHGIMGNAEWVGVSLADVLNMAEVGPNAVEVMFEGADHGPDEVVGDPDEVTYERSLPMEKALHPDTMLAWEMNGEPLTPLHGYPAAAGGAGLVRYVFGQVAGGHTRPRPQVRGVLPDRAVSGDERAGRGRVLHLPDGHEGEVHHHGPGAGRPGAGG